MMKRMFLFWTLLMVSVLSPSGLDASEPVKCVPLRPLTEENVPFQAGELLVYNVRCKVGILSANVAKGYMSIDTVRMNGRNLYKAEMDTKIGKFYGAFVNIRENFTAWLDVSRLRPYMFERDTYENGYFAHDIYHYNWGSDPHIDAELDNSKKGPRKMRLPLDECTFDVISLFCRMRHVDMTHMKPNDRFVMYFVLGSKPKKANLVYLGNEVVDLKNYGEVNTYKFGMIQESADGSIGEVDSDSNMYMWFSADENRIPVRFSAPTNFGSLSGKLDTCSGLRFPFGE